MVKLMINAHFKFNSPKKVRRIEAIKSLKILARTSFQYLNKQKIIYRQYDALLAYVCIWFNKIKNYN